MWENDFKDHARAEFPKECCGLLVVLKGRERYFPCTNIAKNPLEDFTINPFDYMMAEDSGTIIGVCHSHPNLTSQPSLADISGCESTKMPWYIFSLPAEHLNTIKPTGHQVPFVGRPYKFGVHDCGSIVKDYYSRELNIELERFETDVYENWWLTEDKLSLESMLAKGFVQVEDYKQLKKHDVICMANGSKNGWVTHLAIYLGDEIMLHHCLNRLSSKDIFGGYWLKNTKYILRHRDLL